MSHILRVFCYTWCKNLIKCVRVRVINNQAAAGAPAPGNLWSSSRCWCLRAMRIHNEWGIIEDLEFDCPTNCPRHRIDDTPGRGPAYLRRASRHRDHQLSSHQPNLTFYTQYFHLWEDFINTWEVTFRSHPKHRQQYCGRTMTGTMLKMPKFKILATGENENHLNVPISGCKLWSQ